MTKPAKIEGPRVLPDLSKMPGVGAFAALADSVEARVDGDWLLVRLPISEAALASAKPSKTGALRIVAGAGNRWHKIDEAISVLPAGSRLNITFGVPNPAHDKEAAARKRLEQQAAKMGLKLAPNA